MTCPQKKQKTKTKQNTTINRSHLSGADPRFSGGGGAQKIMRKRTLRARVLYTKWVIKKNHSRSNFRGGAVAPPGSATAYDTDDDDDHDDGGDDNDDDDDGNDKNYDDEENDN